MLWPSLMCPTAPFFEGENLAILQSINSECVDLIATDPTFNKRRNMAGLAGKYPDQWYWADTHAHTAGCPADCDLRAVQREWLDEIKARGEIAAQRDQLLVMGFRQGLGRFPGDPFGG